jgi:hypothetical protein
MTKLLAGLVCGLVALAVSFTAVAQTAVTTGPYLFDLLKRPQFRASFDGLFKGEQNVDAWVLEFQRTGNGVADVSRSYPIEGRTYIGSSVCKPHDCGANQLHVLFTEDGAGATAVLVSPRGRRWFGNPTDAQRAVLLRL